MIRLLSAFQLFPGPIGYIAHLKAIFANAFGYDLANYMNVLEHFAGYNFMFKMKLPFTFIVFCSFFHHIFIEILFSQYNISSTSTTFFNSRLQFGDMASVRVSR
jgi:hypothetical protein